MRLLYKGFIGGRDVAKEAETIDDLVAMEDVFGEKLTLVELVMSAQYVTLQRNASCYISTTAIHRGFVSAQGLGVIPNTL